MAADPSAGGAPEARVREALGRTLILRDRQADALAPRVLAAIRAPDFDAALAALAGGRETET